MDKSKLNIKIVIIKKTSEFYEFCQNEINLL